MGRVYRYRLRFHRPFETCLTRRDGTHVFETGIQPHSYWRRAVPLVPPKRKDTTTTLPPPRVFSREQRHTLLPLFSSTTIQSRRDDFIANGSRHHRRFRESCVSDRYDPLASAFLLDRIDHGRSCGRECRSEVRLGLLRFREREREQIVDDTGRP